MKVGPRHADLLDAIQAQISTLLGKIEADMEQKRNELIARHEKLDA